MSEALEKSQARVQADLDLDHFWDTDRKMFQCADGSYSAGLMNFCTKCTAGKYWNSPIDIDTTTEDETCPKVSTHACCIVCI